jgi:putative cell wall-binding protein
MRSKTEWPALAAVIVLAFFLTGAGCLPDSIEVGIMPMTSQLGGVNTHRSGFDVHSQQASWVEADAGGTGPLKFISETDTVYTVGTDAWEEWSAIGGHYGLVTRPLVAYQADATGVHIVNPRDSVEETFVALADIMPDDFGGVWLAYQEVGGSARNLRTMDIRTGAVETWDDNYAGGPAFIEPRVEDTWLSWGTATAVNCLQIDAPAHPIISAPAVGTGVTIERPRTGDNGGLSWTESDGSGYRRIYYRPSGSAETTEILPGGPSKMMGGFDGNYVTWFENYGTGSVRARAIAVNYTVVNNVGDQLTYAEFDPSRFAWDFDTLLWQQRTTDKLFLTRFQPKPPRVKGANRYETLANLAKLRAWAFSSTAGSSAGELKASVEADSLAPVWGADVVVCAGYDSGSPDAIVAPGLCGAYGAPMLLVNYRTVPAATAEAIAYLRDRNGGRINIHVIGGTSAVSRACYKKLSALKGAGTIDRVGGRDRYSTAALVATRMKSVLKSRGDTMPAEAMILNGSDRRKWDDAASTGAISSSQHIPVLFVRRYSVPTFTSTALKKLGLTKRYIVGGPGNVSDTVRKRLKIAKSDRVYGHDKYATSLAVVRWGQAKGWLVPIGSFMLAGHLHEALAAGSFWWLTDAATAPDAPAASAPLPGAPVLLTDHAWLSGDATAYIQGYSDPEFRPVPMLIGGEYSISTAVVRRLLELVPYWWFGI